MAKVVTSVEMIEEWNEATYRPLSQRVAATFQRRNAARQGGSGSWFAPVGAASSATLGTRFARLGRFPMGRAHPQGAVTRLCVKNLALRSAPAAAAADARHETNQTFRM